MKKSKSEVQRPIYPAKHGRLNTTIILGSQWGDEGKGKLVDRLAEQATWVVRFQGGNNAGHTVVLETRS